MVTQVDTASVLLWGEPVGAVSWLADRGVALFEFEPAFLNKGLDISPIHMALQSAQQGDALFSFPALNRETFLGLPGLLADVLPDKFGNQIIDAWLARQGRDRASFNPIERLCYTGQRGMGALTFEPVINRSFDKSVSVEVAELVSLAQQLISQRGDLEVVLAVDEKQNADAILDILRVGTSAGGARPKAVIAMNEQGSVISGQGDVPPGFDYWLLKFDGVTDIELGEPKGYGRIEYAYYLMATAAGINMTPCQLLEEHNRAHFMTRRFDRIDGRRLHMQSLCGLAHFDFNQAGAYSYEQAFMVMRQMRLSKADATEQLRRTVFNVLARNQDDHTKNIAFLMDETGQWRLSPAYDVTYAHNPGGVWTQQHQMSLNGKRDHFTLFDLQQLGASISLSKTKTNRLIDEVKQALADWPIFAKQAGVSETISRAIARQHRKL